MGDILCNVETRTHCILFLHVLKRMQAVNDLTRKEVEERVAVVLLEKDIIGMLKSVDVGYIL